MPAAREDITGIVELAREAGKIVMSYRHDGFSISTKADALDYVTEADHASNAFLSEELRKRFPDDALLLEETPERPGDYSGRVWMVDPLDGTRHFIEGHEGFAVLIGFLRDGKPELGVMYDPVRDVTYFAARGEGAFRQNAEEGPERIRVTDRTEIEGMSLVERASKGEDRPVDQFVETLGIGKMVRSGSMGIKIARVAEGEAEAVFCSNPRAMKWDYCAPHVILEEAGGRITDFEGNLVDYLVPDSEFQALLLASNGVLHEELLTRYSKYFGS